MPNPPPDSRRPSSPNNSTAKHGPQPHSTTTPSRPAHPILSYLYRPVLPSTPIPTTSVKSPETGHRSFVCLAQSDPPTATPQPVSPLFLTPPVSPPVPMDFPISTASHRPAVPPLPPLSLPSRPPSPSDNILLPPQSRPSLSLTSLLSTSQLPPSTPSSSPMIKSIILNLLQDNLFPMLDQASVTTISTINDLTPSTAVDAVYVNTALFPNHANQHLKLNDEEYLRLMDKFNDEEERFHTQHSHQHNN
ncbi:hypothetical protein PTTG_27479 [Puccinia triticina 1-1 BBBD Race 1]|uniref:Uncharacterized protein n=1 Tax=Puccinia triticina (isolate 1-1 / race 1 (BBBD)) TaxID=630390 RepID=A0A180GK61_PUCT1|nr:hypothetical protein PTTG_27479 [Puccinia triticina 1-1 BBBD Race 1]